MDSSQNPATAGARQGRWKTLLRHGAEFSWRNLAARASLRRIGSLVGAIDEQEATLDTVATQTQHAFIAVGEALRQQVMLGSALTGAGEKLLGLARDSEAGRNPMQATAELIRQAFATITACGQQTSEMVVHLDACHEQLRCLHEDEEQLARILGPLRTIQTLFRIEASTLPADLQSIFHSVTVEIARLDQQVSESFSQQSEAISGTKAAIAQASSRLKEEAARQSSEMSARSKGIEDLLDAMQRELGRIQQRDERVSILFREIDQATSGVIVHLQFQDITRQRLEHVKESFAAVRSRFASRGGSSSSSSVCWVATICRLEATQLAAVEDELRGAAASVASGMEEILTRAARIDEEFQATREFDTGASASDAIARVLLETLGEVAGLVNSALSGVEEATRAIRSFSGISVAVSSTMQKLAADIRLIGLNAQIQAVQAASPGLEVLSSTTYAISAETNQAARKIRAGLEDAIARLDQMASLGMALQTSTGGKRQEFDRQGQDCAQRLKAYRTELASVYANISRLLDDLRANARAQHSSGALGAIAFDALSRVRRHIEAIAVPCEKVGASGRIPDDVVAELAALKSRYTMDSERDIHASLVGGADAGKSPGVPSPIRPATGASAMPTAVVAADSGMGENVELF